MTNLVEEIKTIIQNEANNNPPPEKAEIIKTYPDNHADIQTTDKIVSYVEVIGTNEIGQSGIVCYADGLVENGVFITNNTIDIDRIYELLGLKIDKTEAYSLLNEKADKNHIHEPTLWNTPAYNSDYINTSSTANHVDLYQVGKTVILDFYFNFKNLPTSNKIIVNNIPTSYQPVNEFNTLLTSLGSVVILLTMKENNIYLKHYTSGTVNDVITGMITYICKGDE